MRTVWSHIKINFCCNLGDGREDGQLGRHGQNWKEKLTLLWLTSFLFEPFYLWTKQTEYIVGPTPSRKVKAKIFHLDKHQIFQRVRLNGHGCVNNEIACVGKRVLFNVTRSGAARTSFGGGRQLIINLWVTTLEVSWARAPPVTNWMLGLGNGISWRKHEEDMHLKKNVKVLISQLLQC
jgi:hypothetical protein